LDSLQTLAAIVYVLLSNLSCRIPRERCCVRLRRSLSNGAHFFQLGSLRFPSLVYRLESRVSLPNTTPETRDSKLLSVRQLCRGAVHDAVEIDGGDGAVFEIITFARVGVTVFENALHDELVETAVTHDTVFVLF
jgi:hypothetical protein